MSLCNRNTLKISKFLICFVLFIYTIGVIVSWNSPCTGYEPNIYLSTPFIFWLGIVLCYILGIVLIVGSLYCKPFPKIAVYLAYIIMTLAMISNAFLTVIRGYAVNGMSIDVGHHIGYLKTTVDSGLIPSTYYPGIYAETGIFQLITGIDVSLVINHFSIIFLLIFIFGICTIARLVLPTSYEKNIAYIIALLLPVGSSLILFGTWIAFGARLPSVYGILPFYILSTLICMKGQRKTLIPLSLMAVAVVFYHPNVSLICICLSLSSIIFSLTPGFGKSFIDISAIRQIIITVIVLVGTFLLFYLPLYGNTLLRGLNVLFSHLGLGDRGISRSTNLLTTALDSGYNLLTIIQIFGLNILLYGMIIVAAIILIRKYWSNEDYYLFKSLFVCAVTICALILVAMFGSFIGGWMRFLYPIFILSIISFAFVLSHVFNHLLAKTSTYKKIILLICVLIIICPASVVSFHPSPISLNGHYQSQETQFSASDTLLPLIDYDNINTTGIHFTNLARFAQAKYGANLIVSSSGYGEEEIYVSLINKISPSRGEEIVPYHFGYDVNDSLSLSQYYKQGDIIFIIDKDKEYYPTYHPALVDSRWTEEDFQHLNYDSGLQVPYNNGDVIMYLVTLT